MDISKIDKNFSVNTSIKKEDIVFYNSLSEPFKICGLIYEELKFRRMSKDVAEKVSDGVFYLHTNTAGGRLRFKTDSPYIAINAKMENVGKMSHFALSGSCGFDLYVNNSYFASFVPPFDLRDGYEGIIELSKGEMREITINFPLYSDVKELYVGLRDACEILPPAPYSLENPVVYYGSSITQGGCASRPGSAYESILSRELNVDHINLGFSGNARAEDTMAEYISSLDMCAFVYDYDHNAPTAEHLEKTHERMFKTVRNAKPHLPIIIMSRPKYILNDDEKKRLEIIKKTYENAVKSGDKNVYLIEGNKLMQHCGCEGTVDNCHPTDLGFFSMALAISPLLKCALGI